MTVLGLGIVGLGRAAALTWPALMADPRLKVLAGCDGDPTARARFAEATGVAALEWLEQLLALPGLDAVYVSTPAASHAAIAIAAAKAGKHVLVEKPMAVTLAEADAMIAAADVAGTRLLVGPSHGYDPPVALAAAIIASGEVGAPRFIEARAFTDFLYRPRPLADLRTIHGGGAILGQASHQIDMVRRIAGQSVRRVSGWIGDWDGDRPGEGAYGALLRCDGGLTASLTYSGYGRHDPDGERGWPGEMGRARPSDAFARTRAALDSARPRGFALNAGAPIGHERLGTVLVCCERADLELTPDGVIVHDGAASTLRPAPLPAVGRLAVTGALAEAVLDGAAPVFDGRWGRETLRLCRALLHSAALGAEIDLDAMESQS